MLSSKNESYAITFLGFFKFQDKEMVQNPSEWFIGFVQKQNGSFFWDLEMFKQMSQMLNKCLKSLSGRFIKLILNQNQSFLGFRHYQKYFFSFYT